MANPQTLITEHGDELVVPSHADHQEPLARAAPASGAQASIALAV